MQANANFSVTSTYVEDTENGIEDLDVHTLSEKIEELRCQLVDSAKHNTSLTSSSIVLLSQELDKYIVLFQIRKKKSEAAEPHYT